MHYTPKHGSWLNQAEIELSLYSRQCLGKRRIPDLEKLQRVTKAWNRLGRTRSGQRSTGGSHGRRPERCSGTNLPVTQADRDRTRIQPDASTSRCTGQLRSKAATRARRAHQGKRTCRKSAAIGREEPSRRNSIHAVFIIGGRWASSSLQDRN